MPLLQGIKVIPGTAPALFLPESHVERCGAAPAAFLSRGSPGRAPAGDLRHPHQSPPRRRSRSGDQGGGAGPRRAPGERRTTKSTTQTANSTHFQVCSNHNDTGEKKPFSPPLQRCLWAQEVPIRATGRRSLTSTAANTRGGRGGYVGRSHLRAETGARGRGAPTRRSPGSPRSRSSFPSNVFRSRGAGGGSAALRRSAAAEPPAAVMPPHLLAFAGRPHQYRHRGAGRGQRPGAEGPPIRGEAPVGSIQRQQGGCSAVVEGRVPTDDHIPGSHGHRAVMTAGATVRGCGMPVRIVAGRLPPRGAGCPKGNRLQQGDFAHL